MVDYPNRRGSDVRFDELKRHIDLKFTEHTSAMHGSLEPGDTERLIEEHNSMKRQMDSSTPKIDRILDAIDGTVEVNVSGEVVGRVGGIRQSQAQMQMDIANLKHDANGGRGFSIRNRDKLIIGAIAAAPSVAIAGLAVIQYLQQ